MYAYEIRPTTKGYYYIIAFGLQPNFVKMVSKQYSIVIIFFSYIYMSSCHFKCELIPIKFWIFMNEMYCITQTACITCITYNSCIHAHVLMYMYINNLLVICVRLLDYHLQWKNHQLILPGHHHSYTQGENNYSFKISI